MPDDQGVLISKLPESLLKSKECSFNTAEEFLEEPLVPDSGKVLGVPPSELDLIGRIPRGQKIKVESHIECGFDPAHDGIKLVATLENGCEIYKIKYSCSRQADTIWLRSTPITVKTKWDSLFTINKFVCVCQNKKIGILPQIESVEGQYDRSKDCNAGEDSEKADACKRTFIIPPKEQRITDTDPVSSRYAAPAPLVEGDFILEKELVWIWLPPSTIRGCEIISKYKLAWKITRYSMHAPHKKAGEPHYEDAHPPLDMETRYTIPNCFETSPLEGKSDCSPPFDKLE